MILNNRIWVASSDSGNPLYLLPSMANRHGLIAGATGTGKTTTLRVLAEGFSNLGVPVFLSDVKGDLSGLCEKGENKSWIENSVNSLNITNFSFEKFPVHFWDLFGTAGHPVRVSVSKMGPVFLSRILGLSEVQEGVLSIVFKVADDNGLLILDLKDLRSMLNYVGEHKNEYTLRYGNITSQSIGAIQRALLTLEDEGGNDFFGEPSLDIADWIRCDISGKGYINVLNSTTLIHSPKLYSTFLLWMLSELYERLPEVGDLEKPRMVFFFDEAHLLFSDIPKALLNKIVQVVKLIRSKGVGIYFISQSPSDIPDEVLAQLSNRVQHALRAYTPSEQKAVKVAANTFRQNKDIKIEEVITTLGVGEALVSFLDEAGIPQIVSKAKVLPPQSKDGKCSDESLKREIITSEFELKYREMIDRVSAYEILTSASENEAVVEDEMVIIEEEPVSSKTVIKTAIDKEEAKRLKEKEKLIQKRNKQIEKAINSATSSITRSVSNNLVKSVTGGKKTSTKTMMTRAASNVVNSLLRDATKGITRGIFGNIK